MKGYTTKLKRNTLLSLSPYYRPHSQQLNQHISDASIPSQRIDLSGSKMDNGHFCVSGDECSIYPSIPGFAQKTSLQYYQNKGSAHAKRKCRMLSKNTLQVSLPLNIQNSVRASSNCPKRKWSREDALRAIQFEEEFYKQNTNGPCLIIRFPDPPLNPTIVKGFSEEIDKVYFQNNLSPRYCFVRLKSNANIPEVLNDISKIPFGVGYLSAEIRLDSIRVPSTKPELIDPYTLYVGNLSLSVTVETIKQHFPGALSYDLALRSKQKPVRYALIHFETLEKAIEAFKKELQINGRKIVLRFRRAQLNIPAESISSNECETNPYVSRMVTDSTNGHACNTSGNNTDTFSIEVETSRQSSPPVIDLTPNNFSIIRKSSKHCVSNLASYSATVFKTEEPDEDKTAYNSTLPIKEELYDSEYSCEDDCYSSYHKSSLNNLENTYIKTEVEGQEQPCISNYTRNVSFEPNENFDYAEYGGKREEYHFTASVPRKNGQTNCSNPGSFPKRANFRIVQDGSWTHVKDNSNSETKSYVSSKTSLSEKKYIENLYDQLNSTKVFKKEVRSEFDELEEMLREFD